MNFTTRRSVRHPPPLFFGQQTRLGKPAPLLAVFRELYVALSCTSLMQANALTQNQKVAKTDFNRNTFSACPGRPKRSQLGALQTLGREYLDSQVLHRASGTRCFYKLEKVSSAHDTEAGIS